ncbi:addiction module protein [Maribacter dokdonensis]|uniref:addiction module protein n=1 Tax=Maribacter dokdonensis TaxID=320912 RepID=UPI001B3281D4|nr:addiction module protein [Maribacter dokdonensis]
MNQNEEEIELTDEIKAELDRRFERLKNGEGKSYTLAKVRKILAEKRKNSS